MTQARFTLPASPSEFAAVRRFGTWACEYCDPFGCISSSAPLEDVSKQQPTHVAPSLRTASEAPCGTYHLLTSLVFGYFCILAILLSPSTRLLVVSYGLLKAFVALSSPWSHANTFLHLFVDVYCPRQRDEIQALCLMHRPVRLCNRYAHPWSSNLRPYDARRQS